MRSPFESGQIHFVGGALFLCRFLCRSFSIDLLVDHRCRLTRRSQLVDRHNIIDGLAHGGLCRLLPLGETLIENATYNAGLSLLGVADLTSLVNGFSGEAEVGDSGEGVPA